MLGCCSSSGACLQLALSQVRSGHCMGNAASKQGSAYWHLDIRDGDSSSVGPGVRKQVERGQTGRRPWPAEVDTRLSRFLAPQHCTQEVCY